MEERSLPVLERHLAQLSSEEELAPVVAASLKHQESSLGKGNPNTAISKGHLSRGAELDLRKHPPVCVPAEQQPGCHG